jgi:predicted acetyltransferase
MTQDVELRVPDHAMLPFYVAALEAGWSPSNTRDISGIQLAAIRADPDAFLSSVHEQPGAPLTLADGTTVARLPGPTFWIWDGAFCGSINLRYQAGTLDLPPHVSGHVGYAVVPWKRGQGIATQALRLILPIAAGRGLSRVLVTCDVDNVGSRRVAERAGGAYAGTAPAPEHGSSKLLFWLATG